MGSLLKGINLLRHGNRINYALIQQTVRCAHGWNKDFKPGPYPKTKAEREAAAKKYNLLPEEYKPYADDGCGYGDYPKLRAGLGTEAKDPFYPYDYPDLKRNYGEAIHVDTDLYGEDRYSQPSQPRYPNYYYFLCFSGVMAFFFLISAWLDNYKLYRPVAAKQYPGDGRKHYTFDMD